MLPIRVLRRCCPQVGLQLVSNLVSPLSLKLWGTFGAFAGLSVVEVVLKGTGRYVFNSPAVALIVRAPTHSPRSTSLDAPSTSHLIVHVPFLCAPPTSPIPACSRVRRAGFDCCWTDTGMSAY